MADCQKSSELEAEIQRLLAEMDALRGRYVLAAKSDPHPKLKLLEQMAATSRRFREASEQILALAAPDGGSASTS
ncbi:MAG: hypothetical protein OES38_13070 [Gammaproteobacteria bacterium]|nr:hypothetical protein [Gammaproteobacteria bacterium]